MHSLQEKKKYISTIIRSKSITLRGIKTKSYMIPEEEKLLMEKVSFSPFSLCW